MSDPRPKRPSYVGRGQPPVELERPPKVRGPKGHDLLIPGNCIIGAQEVRVMCSGRRRKPISRDTFARWRKERGFPEPFREIAASPLWDRREVREWLRRNGIYAR